MRTRCMFNFDTGEMEIGFDSENIINARLVELNQHSKHYQEKLNFELTASLDRAYELGRMSMAKEMALFVKSK